MKRLTVASTMACGLIPLAYIWLECAYRIWLYFESGSKPYVNHVADSYFSSMLIWALASAVTLIGAALVAFSLRMRIPTAICTAGALLAIAHPFTLGEMRKSKALVTYGEFTRQLGP